MSRIKTILIVLLFAVMGVELATFVVRNSLLPASFSFRQISAVKYIQEVFSPPVPSELVIPSLGVDATVEAVTVDSKNRMAVPKDIYDVGWYSLGPKPGQVGNAVIDGHYNTPTGAPNVFYNLDTMHVGDAIQIVDAKNHKYSFFVTDVKDYPTNAIPLNTIFGPSNQAKLTLITCSGDWNRIKHDYSERTVVYAIVQQ